MRSNLAQHWIGVILTFWALGALSTGAWANGFSATPLVWPDDGDHRARLVAAVELSHADPRFGGLSGALLVGEGLIVVSDKGTWASMPLAFDADAALAAVGAPMFTPVLGRNGRAVRGARSDAEALAFAPGGGQSAVWIAFERRHRLAASPLPFAEPPAKGAPPEPPWRPPGETLSVNGGVEALARLSDDAILAIAEDPPAGRSDIAAWRVDGALATPVSIERRDGFAPTGADLGPDGALYLLERRFSLLAGPAMRIRRFAPNALHRSALGAGETLTTLTRTFPIDNMEALAARAGPDGTVDLLALSDDNFNPLQRTVLLQFRVAAVDD